ncbi:MAG: hypothetical protein HPY90_12895 [Syntrophothermus sp.]|uniref:hypothetical protein n=1 Tax=Syntrophothermus sp. TaxID=2736299 RepID=UPI0025801BD4|nr:hypothetical protein [Syntrophothermus sp.]NSW84145.1 hypothetical protein [Syntrophothermus sp.]
MSVLNSHPEVYARSLTLNLKHDYKSLLVNFLINIARNLKEKGYPLIGHIKLAVQDTTGSVFYASIADQSTGPQYQGELQVFQKPVTFRLNAVLYGVKKTVMQEIIENEINAFYPIVAENSGNRPE